jgi:hypothetical protein
MCGQLEIVHIVLAAKTGAFQSTEILNHLQEYIWASETRVLQVGESLIILDTEFLITFTHEGVLQSQVLYKANRLGVRPSESRRSSFQFHADGLC